jgi:hypothetical protein
MIIAKEKYFMRTLVRSLILFGLVIWIGGLLFFGVVVAPVAFGSLMPMLSDPVLGLHIAGTVVRDSLLRLHDIGMICGVILLVLCIVERVARMTRRSIAPQLVLLAAMLGLTAFSQFSVIPQMDSLRIRAGTAMDNPAITNAAEVDFNRLHRLSTRLEGVVLLCGLGLIVLYARPEPAR